MRNTLNEIGIIAQKMSKQPFPDHVCAQANRIMTHAGSICENADLMKYQKEDCKEYLINSLKNTAASCVLMISELEKDK